MEQKNYLFEFLNQITLVKDPNFISTIPEDERKKLSPYICNLWISMNENLISLADYLNQYTFFLSLEQFYQICRYVIPKHKAHFNWIKTDKKKGEKDPDWLVDILCRELEFVSKKQVREYLDIISGKSDSEFLYIIGKYGLEDKQKKYIEKRFGKFPEKKNENYFDLKKDGVLPDSNGCNIENLFE